MWHNSTSQVRRSITRCWFVVVDLSDAGSGHNGCYHFCWDPEVRGRVVLERLKQLADRVEKINEKKNVQRPGRERKDPVPCLHILFSHQYLRNNKPNKRLLKLTQHPVNSELNHEPKIISHLHPKRSQKRPKNDLVNAEILSRVFQYNTRLPRFFEITPIIATRRRVRS